MFLVTYFSAVGVGLLTQRPLKYRARHPKMTSKKRGVFAGGRRGFENDTPQPLRLATKNAIGKNRGFVSTRCDKVQNSHAGALKKRPKFRPESQQQKQAVSGTIVSR